MGARKTTNKYNFTVEGKTEKWYLEWLRDQINALESSDFNVSIDCKIYKNPLKGAKTFNVLRKTNIYHLFDYESNDENHEQNFINTMEKMKEAESLGKQIKFLSGYSNLTFDLWIILHKVDCYETYANRNKYIRKINTAFGEKFKSMDEFKEEANFKRCLNKMDLSDVSDAIRRSEMIMQKNVDNNYTLHNYKNFYYYKENPSLYVGEIVKKIMRDSGLFS